MRTEPGHPGHRAARAVDTVVVGAGQSGLAMSRCLAAQSIDHVVLERGCVANAWRTERWDSLRLLTPSWQTRLPGLVYSGDEPDGFMSSAEVVDFIARYASVIAAPVRTGTTVLGVEPRGRGYRVVTDRGIWTCRSLVIASGAFNVPVVPALAGDLPAAIATLTAREYRNPDGLEPGGVLIVGASATGLQLAREIHRSGRPVTLAVGEHVRLPRSYRGRDVQWWMDATGVLDQRYTDVEDIDRARRVPSPQLAGTEDGTTLDLNALTALGVRTVGRLVAVRDGRALFSGSLANLCALADLKQNRLLAAFDDWARERGVDAELPRPTRPAPTRVAATPCLGIDLAGHGIRTVIWATGLKPDHSWLNVPAFDRKGRIRHDGGIVAAPGIYVMGLPFLRRRKSSYIHGAGDDARDLAAHLGAYLAGDARRLRAAG